MTHASLSPDLDPPLAIARPDSATAGRAGIGPEASLWLLALTSLTLVFASLLLGMLARSVVTDASLSGFAAAIALVTGGLGLVAVAYVLLIARRAGYLRTTDGFSTRASQQEAAHDTITSAGLRVAPTIPAGLAYRRRQQLAEERAERRKQARAIDAAELQRQPPRAPVPTAVRTQAPQVPARPVAPPPPASVARTAARRASGPSFLRLDPPRVRPRGQAALLQVGAASVRAPFVPPRPHPVLPGSSPRR